MTSGSSGPDELQLKVNLDVLASTCIKRKKPWPKLALVGESIFLLDHQRVSVLYMGTGKTKKKIPKLHGVASEAILLTHSSNGAFIGGLLSDGNLFLWHKNSDTLKYITGLSALATSATSLPACQSLPYMCIADTGFAILLVNSNFETFIWEIEDLDTLLVASPGSRVQGSWSYVEPGKNGQLPKPGSVEMAVNAMFTFTNTMLGRICICSFVFANGQDINVSTVLLRWFEDQDTFSVGHPKFTAEWQLTVFPVSSVSSHAQPVCEAGALVARHTHDGQLLAIAVNQLSTHCNRLVYVAPLPGVITISDLYGMGARFPLTQYSRTYWIADMEWLCDDLFLACITGQGSVFLVPRLGEPILIQTFGRGIEMGPKYFLPLHPLVTVQGNVVPDSDDPMRQRFSVAVHPSLQLVLFSDGYMVTAVELSDCGTAFSCLSLMRLLSDAAHARLKCGRDLLDWLRSTKLHYSASDLADFAKRRRLGQNVDQNKRPVYRFEATPANAYDETMEPDYFSTGGKVLVASSGRLVFGDSDNMMTTREFLGLNATPGEDKRYNYIEVSAKQLMFAWGLITTHAGVWTVNHETEARNIVDGFMRLFAAMLSSEENDSLQRVLQFFKRMLEMSSCDGLGQHLIVVSLMFVRNTVELLLRAKSLRKISSFGVLLGASLIIRYAELHFARTYGVKLSPHSLRVNAVLYDSLDRLEKNTYSFQVSVSAITREQILDGKWRRGLNLGNSVIRQNSSLVQRLFSCWQLLHRYALRYYESMQRHDSEPAAAAHQKRKHVSFSKLQNTVSLLSAINDRMQSLNVTLADDLQRTVHSTRGDALYLDGSPELAIGAWLNYLQNITDDETNSAIVCRVLHSILYAQLLSYRLRDAVYLVELTLRLTDVRKVAAVLANARLSPLPPVEDTLQSMPNKDKSSAGRPVTVCRTKFAEKLIQTIGRVIATYFTKSAVFVFPPHHPLPIPALWCSYQIRSHELLLNRDRMIEAIRFDQLDAVWTAERALEYLLVGGLLADAVWFIGQLGDWKGQLTVAATIQRHWEELDENNDLKQKLHLPDHLQPASLAQQHILPQIKESLEAEHVDSKAVDDVTSLVFDRVLISLLCGHDTIILLLRQLLDRLLNAVKRFQCLVPDDVYLPAPPIYCPQPVITEEERKSLSPIHLAEVECRQEVALLIRNLMIVFRASRSVVPAISWFSKKVLSAYRKARKLQKDASIPQVNRIIKLMEPYTSVKSIFTDSESDVDIATVLSTFRDLCCVIWMLHNRDELSQAMRKKASQLHLHLNRIDQLNPEKWTAVCDTALTSCVRLLPFAEFMRAEHQLQSSALSLLAELPRTADTALKLARLFPDNESVSPQTQEKLRQILKDWQSVFVEDDEQDGSTSSARGKTLAVLYHELSRQYPDLLERKRKAFGRYDEEVVFSIESFGTSPDLTIGSRPCESTGEFMEFLDIFFSVSFVNDLTLQNRRQDLPLLNLYVKDIRNFELNSKSLPAPKLRRNISINMNSDAVQPAVKRRVVFETPVLRQAKSVSARVSGLFRSRSVDCMTENANSPAVSRRNSLQPREVDVLAADTDGNVVRESKPVVAGLLNTNNNNSGVNRKRYVPVRSVSLIEYNDVSEMSERSNSLQEFSGLQSVLSGLNVKNWMFPNRWLASEKMAEWFSSQTAHKLAEKSSSAGAVSAIRVRVSPKMLAYALWLLENSSFVVPPKVEDVVVAVVSQSTGNMPPPQPSRSNPIPSPTAGLDNGRGEQTRKGRLRRQKKESGTHNRSQIPEEPEEAEEYDANQWGTKRLAFTAAEEPDSRVARANTNKNESVNSSECSVSVSSQLDDDDVGQLQQAMHETLARISRPGTTQLEDTDGNGRFKAATANVRPAAAKQDSAINTTLPVAAQSKLLEDPRPSGNDLVNQLQRAVRDEMRRIMQVQQQGILAVLNVLDDRNDETVAPPAPPAVRRVDNKTSSDRFQQRQETSPASVNNSSNNNNNKKPETSSHLVDDEHTDVSVSLLTSEEDQPAPAPALLASKQSPPPSKPAASGTVLTALNELKNLQSVGNRQLRLLRLNRTAGVDKENRPYDSNRPFTSLIDALKQMNGELGANKKGDSSSGASQLRLLRMFPPTDLDSAAVRLPRVTPARISGPPVQPSPYRMTSAGIPMPSIANGMPSGVAPTHGAFTGNGMLRFPPPAAGYFTGLHAGSSDDLPFPMLRLMDVNTRQVPYFVPPVHVPSFQRNQQLEDHAGQRLFASPPFLKLDEQRDLPSPAPSNDTVTVEKKRKSRRPRKAPSPEEAENTVSDESLDMPKQQPAAVKTYQQTSSSPVRTRTDKTEPNQRDDGATKLHSGFALTPGMFDEYLREQPTNGSDMVSSAQLHYQAVQAVQSPKQRAVLKKDMATDTNEEQPAVSAFSAVSGGQKLSVGSLLPPDVYMQLQLPLESARQNSVTPGARTFLNVADINSDVLSDLVFKQPTSQAPAREDAKVPNLEPNSEDSNLFGDEVTLSVLKSAREPHSIGGPLAVRAGLSDRSPYAKSKDRGKLMMDNMNSQFAAITAMAQHMENDFRNTRLLMTAVDDVGDDVIPRPQTARAAATGKPFNVNDSQRPVNVQRSPPPARRAAAAWLDNDEEKENRTRDDTSAEPGMYSLPTAEGDLNTDQWPHGLAARMLEQAMQATDDGVHLSRSDLKELFRVLSPPTTSRFAAERTSAAADSDLQAEQRKREVREWMLKKREERMAKFQAENEERRAAEKHPYKPPSSGSKTKRDLEEAEKDRLARKRAMHDLRSQDASRLTYELLSDEIPVRPSSPVRDIVTASKPDTRGRRPKSSPTRQKTTLTKADSDAKAWLDRADEATRIYQDIYDNYSRLLVNAYDDDGDFQTMNADDRKTSRPATDRQEKRFQSGVPTTQSRPFTDLVRMRRPDVLADNRNRTSEMIRRKPPNTSADPTKAPARSENQAMQQNATSSRSMKFNDSSRPRVVKTYTERLQEMKQARPSSVQSSRSVRPSPKYTSKQQQSAAGPMQAAQKPRKTLTYAEQLKSLQLPKEQYYQKSARSEDGRAISGAAGPQRQRSKGAPSTGGQRTSSREYGNRRSSGRSRPYANPYSESFDDASNLSSWSIDDNVRRLIYGNSVSERNTINSAGSILDVSDLPVDNPYVNTVDVDDLESVVSGMSKVSWSSFLDWNEVDKLVEEDH